MNTQHHIEELEREIEHIRKQPVKFWLGGKITKAIKIRNIKRKIESLKKKSHGK